MKIYLIRHARPRPEHEDSSKSLSEAGLEEIRITAAWLAAKGDADLQKIFHSGKARARQTAQILFECVGAKEPIAEAKGLNPNDSPSPWVRQLTKNEVNGNLAIVGHLPFLGNLASLLLHRNPGGGYVEFNTATIACLARQNDGICLLEWVISPADIK